MYLALLLVCLSATPTDLDAALKKSAESKKILILELGDCINDELPRPRLTTDFVRCRLPEATSLSQLKGAEYGGSKCILFVNPERQVISVLTPAYFSPSDLEILMNLPPACLESRMLLWAARRHPAQPRSAFGQMNPDMWGYAQNWARHQASVGQQYHSNIIAGGMTSEIVAETFDHYPGICEGAEQLIYMWSQSSSHWGALCRGYNQIGMGMAYWGHGRWYGCGCFR